MFYPDKKNVTDLTKRVQRTILNKEEIIDAGWSSLEARWAHNPKAVGSNPTPAIKKSGKASDRRQSLAFFCRDLDVVPEKIC